MHEQSIRSLTGNASLEQAEIHFEMVEEYRQFCAEYEEWHDQAHAATADPEPDDEGQDNDWDGMSVDQVCESLTLSFPL